MYLYHKLYDLAKKHIKMLTFMLNTYIRSRNAVLLTCQVHAQSKQTGKCKITCTNYWYTGSNGNRVSSIVI
jgi:hypothetical protein